MRKDRDTVARIDTSAEQRGSNRVDPLQKVTV
ncbi:hypothetical protein ES707_01196 [subsurface metagenome]